MLDSAGACAGLLLIFLGLLALLTPAFIGGAIIIAFGSLVFLDCGGRL